MFDAKDWRRRAGEWEAMYNKAMQQANFYETEWKNSVDRLREGEKQNKRFLSILESMSGEDHTVTVDGILYTLRNPLFYIYDRGLSIKHADGEMFFATGSFKEVSNTNPRQGKPSFIRNH